MRRSSAEDVQPAEPPPRLAGQGPGGEELAALVQRCEMAEVCVLKLGCRLLVQLGRVRRREEQYDGELVELHAPDANRGRRDAD